MNQLNKRQQKALIRKATGGDTNAIEELCKLKANSILYICTSMTGNKYDGEDLSQEVIILMWKNIKMLKNSISLDAWLYRIIKNEYTKLSIRNSVNSEEIHMGEALEIMVEKNTQFLPDKFLDEQERKKLISSMLESLPAMHKFCMLMYYYENMSYREIANVLETTEKDVSNILYRSKLKMRDTLSKQKDSTDLLASFPALVSLPVLGSFMKEQAAGMGGGGRLVQTALAQMPQKTILFKAAGAKTASVSGGMKAVAAAAALATVTIATTASVTVAQNYQDHQRAQSSSVSIYEQVKIPQMPLAEMRSSSVESVYEIVTLEDMIGASDANLLRGFTQTPPAPAEFEAFLQRTGLVLVQEGQDGSDAFRLYGLQRQNKLLMLITWENAGGGIQGLVFKFTDSGDEIPSYTDIIRDFENWK